jgi:hypothetical protein
LALQEPDPDVFLACGPEVLGYSFPPYNMYKKKIKNRQFEAKVNYILLGWGAKIINRQSDVITHILK